METPFDISVKFTNPGDAETEIESPKMADKFTPAIFDRTCALAPGAEKSTRMKKIAQPNARSPSERETNSPNLPADHSPDLHVPIRTWLLK